jgi:DNA-binding transcriptional LysR family regulator
MGREGHPVKTDLELRHLRTFVTVVDVGSHTRAARALGVAQSTVSETLAALERALGVALFRKSPALTPAGEVVLAHARKILAMTSELAGELARVSSAVTTTLVVAAVESISAYVLPSRLAALRERWPNARIEVITASCPEIRERVAAGTCDVGLVLEGEDGDAGDELARSRFVIFGGTSHALAGRDAGADELRRCDFYMCDAGGSYHQVLRGYFDAAGTPAPRTQSMGTIEGVKRAVAMDCRALGLLPAHAVERELAAGALVEVQAAPALPGLVLRAVCLPRDSDSPMVDELLERLRGARLASALH